MKKDGFLPIEMKLIEISENGSDWEEFTSLLEASRKIPFLNPTSISYAMKHPQKITISTGESIVSGVHVNRKTNKIFFIRQPPS